MKYNNNNDQFDETFWAFIYLIIEYPEKYLNNKGNVIFNIAQDNGKCKSIEVMSRHLKKSRGHTSLLCNKLKKELHVDLKSDGQENSIEFHKHILYETKQWLKLVTR